MSMMVYSAAMEPLGVLTHADRIGYDLRLNDLSSASFRLPEPDAGNALCAMRRFVRMTEDGREVGLFRICRSDAQPGVMGAWTAYTLEHAIATLSDDIIPGQVDMGGEGATTADVLREILSHQSVTRWVLGECDFDDEFLYTTENDTLLDAFFAVLRGITAEYEVAYDTSGYPFTVHVLRARDAGAQVVLGRNLTTLRRVEATDKHVTRLYCFGNGEGVNQTGIARVNGGIPYLDAPNIDPDDPIVGVMVDSKCDDPAALKAEGEQLLARLCVPQVQWTIGAIDLFGVTGQSGDDAQPGAVLTVLDGAIGAPLRARITRRQKSDMLGSPGALTLTISTGDEDASAALSSLMERQGVHELYSQGMTSLYADSGVDAADASHAVEVRFYIPDEMRRINRILLSLSLERFRATSRGAAAGGYEARSTRSGGSSTSTSEEGGGATVSTAAKAVTSDFVVYAPSDGSGAYSYFTDYADGSGGSHRHKFQHYHRGLATVNIPAMPMTISSHSHKVNVPAHEHAFEVPAHEHGIEYGIYDGPRADSLTLTVDGTEVDGITQDTDELDITRYLSVDADGRIRRGTWHRVTITPGSLTRIRWNLFVQMSVAARGGGDY